MARLLIFLCFLGACSANIMDVLQLRRETTLISLLKAAGLDTDLSGTGPFTVFAPTNYAFSRVPSATLNSLKNDTAQLAELLKYHVVSGVFTSKDLMVNEKMLDSVAGPKIRVNYYMFNNHITLEGAMVSTADIKTTNGIVHIVDSVMMPPTGSIADIIAADPNLTMLKAAVDAAGLTQALQDGPYTLLAPTDAAVARLGNDTIQALMGNTELLKTILLYHVIHGTLYTSGMHSGSLQNLEETDRERVVASFSAPFETRKRMTLPESSILARVYGSAGDISNGSLVQVDGARVTKRDISATNGVIHEIDHVLIPASARAAVAALTNP